MISNICQLSRKGHLFLFCLCLLFSCNKNDLVSPDQVQKLQTETLEQTAVKIFDDPIFQKKLDYELKMSQLELSLNSTQLEARLNKIKVLLEKKHYSKEDIEYIAAELGFNSVKEYFSYLNLGPLLAQKYSMDRFSIEEKQELSKLLINKQLENLDPASSLNPECEKCAWDYQSCVSGYQTGYFVESSTNFTSQPGWLINYQSQEYYYQYATAEAPIITGYEPINVINVDSQITSSLSYSYSTKNCRAAYDQCLVICRL